MSSKVCVLCGDPFYGNDLCKPHYQKDYRQRTGVKYKRRIDAKPRNIEAYWKFVVTELGIVGANSRTQEI
jgi:hypothetical protein